MLVRKSSSNGTTTRAQEHAGGAVDTIAIIRSNNIEPAIAVHIAQGHGFWFSSCGEVYIGLEGAIAIAQEHAGAVDTIAIICGDDIKFAIAVDIAQGTGFWICSCGEVYIGFKGAIAIAQEHAGGVRGPIRSEDVEFTIAVHIAKGHGVWTISRSEVCFGSKGSIAIAQEHAGIIR